ncbi:MAG: hypothetical protein V1735_06115 [Nanoarchaeota archaeon]
MRTLSFPETTAPDNKLLELPSPIFIKDAAYKEANAAKKDFLHAWRRQFGLDGSPSERQVIDFLVSSGQSRWDTDSDLLRSLQHSIPCSFWDGPYHYASLAVQPDTGNGAGTTYHLVYDRKHAISCLLDFEPF